LVDRIAPVGRLEDLAGCGLVVEAIVERLDVKQQVLGRIEPLLGPDGMLATNTSSLSVTAIGRALGRPERFAGMHFFNPAPVMKLVEVVSGAATAPDVAGTILATAQAWGKVAVRARSTPGFIVNRVARPYYAEAWRLVEEGVADHQTIDTLLVDAGGFRLGPFALMDLIGHDVNYAVTSSVFDACFGDPRYRPSLLQKDFVDAGRLGRKSGRGVYAYPAADVDPTTDDLGRAGPDRPAPVEVDGLQVVATTGRLAVDMAVETRTPTIVLDWARPGARRLGFAASPDVSADQRAAFRAALGRQGIDPVHLKDSPGLVVFRTIAMLVDEAYEAALQGIATPADIDLAMRYGVNYPQGPFAWAEAIGHERIAAGLDAIHSATRDPRYRGSLGLRREVLTRRCVPR
jgi:3-hydroxybutyryl-CoA dehydrogenase